MRYTASILKMVLGCCVLLSVAGVVLAQGTDTVPEGAVNPVNAVIATILILIAGGFIYIKRHRSV